MPSFSSILRTLGPRLLASVLSGVATYVGVKTSGAVQIDPAAAAEVVTAILLTYSTTHRAASSQVNKGDAAIGRMVEAENRASSNGSTVVVPKKAP